MQPSKLMLVLVLIACARNSGDTATPIQTQRNGQTANQVPINFIDNYPSLSSNALKLTYISGRTGNALHVFTMSRSAIATTFDNLTQMTNTGLKNEDYAIISPDGNYVLTEGATDTGRALVLCNFAGSTCSTVTTAPRGTHRYAFSPDSTLFYYFNGTATTGATISVATVAAPTSAATAGTPDHWLDAFWMPVASGYQIIAQETSTTIGKINLVSLTFASQAAASSATSATIAANIAIPTFFDQGPKLVTGAASRFLVVNALKPTKDNLNPELSSQVSDADIQKFPAISEMHTYSSSGTDEGAIALKGTTLVQAFLGADNDTIFSLQSIAARCSNEAFSFGEAFVVSSKSAKTSDNMFLKRTDDKTKLPAVASNICDRTIDGVGGRSDLGMRNLVVNPGATASAYSIAWVENSSADPGNTTADPEVYVMDFANSTKTITAVKPNYQ